VFGANFLSGLFNELASELDLRPAELKMVASDYYGCRGKSQNRILTYLTTFHAELQVRGDKYTDGERCIARLYVGKAA